MFSSLYVPSTCSSTKLRRDVRLWQAASGVTSSYDALIELFECLGSFLKRLEIYMTIPPSPMMTDIIVQIMAEVLSVLALATKQVKQGRFSEYVIRYTLPWLNMPQRNLPRSCWERARSKPFCRN
jgi:hypothetical protein